MMKLFLAIVFLASTISMTQAVDWTKLAYLAKTIYPCIKCMGYNCLLPGVKCAWKYYNDRKWKDGLRCLADACLRPETCYCVKLCLFKKNPALRGKQMHFEIIWRYANIILTIHYILLLIFIFYPY